MKKYFQKLYNETGVKPFTFLNCFLCILLPIIVLIIAACMQSNEVVILTFFIVGFVVGIAGNIFIQFRRFSDVKRAFLLTLLNFLASIHFFCKLIVFPLVKLFMNLAGSMTSIQTGNFQQAQSETDHALNSNGAKLSAFNWFVYDGRKFEDVEGEETPIVYENANAYDTTLGRSYTNEEDRNARNLGYTDAYSAVNSGVKVEELNK